MVKSKKVEKTKFMEWVDQELERDPAFQQRVEEVLNKMRIEQDIIALREERGLTQEKLAKMLRVSQPAIAKIESGKAKNLGVKTLVRLATALGGELKLRIVRKRSKAKVAALHP
jgi:DNA-binding XRE family transcriptional regulator